jgi:dihydrofolate reductase
MPKTPLISQIVAMTENRVIGRDNAMPWHLPADLAHFKQTTLGKPIVMGRKAHEAIGRPLPGRRNIVMTRNPDYAAAGCDVVHSAEQALAAAGDVGEVAIIGGEDIYRLFLPVTNLIHLTLIHAELEGDTWFPALDEGAWRIVEEQERPADARNPYRMTFQRLERIET